MRVDWGRFVLLGLAGGMAAVACFSEHSPSTPNAAANCDLSTGPGAGGSTLIAIRNFAFQANEVSVQVGSSVTWVNCEPAGTPSHTTHNDAGAWQSSLLSPGESFTQTFDRPGVFPYHCDPHPFMTGRITVH
jgi:plastocyanin